jgi:hypothetical protein
MPTYTVTRDVTRPNTSTLFPEKYIERHGYSNLVSSGKVSLTASYDSDNLVQTCTFVWESKEEYKNNQSSADNPDSTWKSAKNLYNDYMATAGITGKVTEEDGTVRVFNASNKTWEDQE